MTTNSLIWTSVQPVSDPLNFLNYEFELIRVTEDVCPRLTTLLVMDIGNLDVTLSAVKNSRMLKSWSDKDQWRSDSNHPTPWRLFMSQADAWTAIEQNIKDNVAHKYLMVLQPSISVNGVYDHSTQRISILPLTIEALIQWRLTEC